jgi:three-Cys-motif partner protein
VTREPDTEVDDGLPCPAVGNWAEVKYRLVSLYAALFSTGMKGKWQNRTYIELNAGAGGVNRVRGSDRVIAGSPIRALRVDDPFDNYIFCEKDEELLGALRSRVERIAPRKKVTYISGDSNLHVEEICSAIPAASAAYHVLSLCFVDPFDIGIKFQTLRTIAGRYVDFLVLLALYMDANRNYDHYVNPKSTKVDDFLGSPTWRDRWETAQREPITFPTFLAREFAGSMEELGYLPTPLYTMKEVRSGGKNLPLYRLALFSRHQRAREFWGEVLKYSTDQQRLF